MPYLKGYAVKCGGSLFYYTDGHYSYYVPDRAIYPSTMQSNASEAIRASNYVQKDKGYVPTIVKIRIEYEPVDMKNIENEFNKDRMKAIRQKVSDEDIRFIKENM